MGPRKEIIIKEDMGIADIDCEHNENCERRGFYPQEGRERPPHLVENEEKRLG